MATQRKSFELNSEELVEYRSTAAREGWTRNESGRFEKTGQQATDRDGIPLWNVTCLTPDDEKFIVIIASNENPSAGIDDDGGNRKVFVQLPGRRMEHSRDENKPCQIRQYADGIEAAQ